MYKGDISNEQVARLVVVWEGLLALPPDEPKGVTRLFKGRAKKSAMREVNAYTLNELLARRIWDVVWRKHMSVDVVTFLGVDHEPFVRHWVEHHHLPVGHVWSTDPDILARELAYRPDIAAVFDPDEGRRFRYGSKGRLMSPTTIDFFGTV